MRNEHGLTYLHADHLGSTVLTTNGSTSQGSSGYLAYGSQRSGNELGTENRFTGQKGDGTGLQYYNARYYDPQLGTFISPDTLVPDPTAVIDYNRYVYARANPLRFVDPSGHCIDGGQAGFDSAGNQACWQSAILVYNSMKREPKWWGKRFVNVTPDQFLSELASYAAMGQAWMEDQLNAYRNDVRNNVYQPKNNPSPTVNELSDALLAAPAAVGNAICNIWDCPAIALDTASLGTSIAQTGAVACTATGVGAPACGPAAAYLTYLDMSINATSLAYSTYGYAQDEETLFDLSVSLADIAKKPIAKALGAGASSTPGVGVAYDTLMLMYDLAVDPFVTTPGGAGGAR